MFQVKRSTAELCPTVSAEDVCYDRTAAGVYNGNRAGVCLVELLVSVPEMFRPANEFSHVDLVALSSEYTQSPPYDDTDSDASFRTGRIYNQRKSQGMSGVP